MPSGLLKKMVLDLEVELYVKGHEELKKELVEKLRKCADYLESMPDHVFPDVWDSPKPYGFHAGAGHEPGVYGWRGLMDVREKTD